MSVLSVDPGDNTGWAQWSDEGVLIAHGIMSDEDFIETLAMLPTGMPPYRVIVIETWRLRTAKAKQQGGSTMRASQVIGALRLFAAQHRSTVVMQEVQAKVMASMHSGIKVPSNHSLSHDIDAILHGHYYFTCVDVEPDVAVLRSA